MVSFNCKIPFSDMSNEEKGGHLLQQLRCCKETRQLYERANLTGQKKKQGCEWKVVFVAQNTFKGQCDLTKLEIHLRSDLQEKDARGQKEIRENHV